MWSFSLWTMRLAVAAAALMLGAASPSFAAGPGGGGHGGGHAAFYGSGYGGGRYGGFGFDRGFGRGRWAYGPDDYGGYGLGYGYGGWGSLGWPYYTGWGWPYYGGWWPYYAGEGDYYTDLDIYGGPHYYQMYSPELNSTSSVPSVATTDVASLNIHVPESAQVWVNDKLTTETGSWRSFISPPLKIATDFHFDIRAQWTDPNGETVDQTRQITVRAGQLLAVDFLRPQ